MEVGQAYLGWVVLAVGWSSCGADPHTGDSTGPGETEGPGEERQPLGGAALEPGGMGERLLPRVGQGWDDILGDRHSPSLRATLECGLAL